MKAPIEQKVSVNLPKGIVDAMNYIQNLEGMTKSQIVRKALMVYLNINGLNKPFVAPDETVQPKD